MYRNPGDTSAGAGQHHQHSFLSASTPSSSFSQTQFPSPLFALDPSLHNSPQHLHPGAQHGLQQRQQTPERRPGSETQGTMQPPASISPRIKRTSSPAVPPSSGYTPLDRSLPSKNVTAENLTDAYVAFILYCNPHFPLSTSTEDLRTNFNSSPKSDGKDFETFKLFELLKRFDAKEIKTWGQLALDLGVEAPDVQKGQSVQKVQQYTVRLKRWMRAMHIDAFFEYLLGKQHAYFTEIPTPSEPYPAGGRDGVLAEEDLAIRALDPAFRPKRGRRRNSDAEREDATEAEEPASKHMRVHSGQMTSTPMSAYPPSAHPSGAFGDPWAMASAVAPQTYAPWGSRSGVPQTAASATAPSQLRWQLHDSSTQIASPHPMTAQPTSMAAHIEAAFENEPKSAVTPARRRRKHGPAVSSAWPSANAPGAKPRGRPPASRNVQDGPFSTFPVDPSNERNLPQPAKTIAPVPRQSSTEVQDFAEAPPRPSMPTRQSTDGTGRLKGLSLQVPQHTGGPVRLATPPAPRVLLEGEAVESDSRSDTRTPITDPASRGVPRSRVIGNMQVEDREVPGFAFEALKRILASDLLRAYITGRQHRLTGDEAKRLADAVLFRLGLPREDTESSRDDIARLTAASWLGLGEQLNVPLGPATSHGKRLTVTRFRMDVDGYEEIVSAQEEPSTQIREVFDLSWIVTMNGCNGSFELKGLELYGDAHDAEDDSHDRILKHCMTAVKQIGNAPVPVKEVLETAAAADPRARGLPAPADIARLVGDEDDSRVDWKQKYLALEFGARIAKGEMVRLKEEVLQKVIEVLLHPQSGYGA